MFFNGFETVLAVFMKQYPRELSALSRGYIHLRESQGLISLLAYPLVKYCLFGVSPANHSDSDSETTTAQANLPALYTSCGWILGFSSP